MEKTVSSIQSSGKCVLCGMCKSVCPTKAIELVPNTKSGFYEVKLNSSACVSCGLCLSACPMAEDVRPSEDTLGEYSEIMLCHSANPYVRHSASSGGVINSLIRCLIENNLIDSVLTVRENISSYFDTEVTVINKDNYTELLDNPRAFASRYVSVPVLEALDKCAGRTAVVGTPCQIKALSKYEKSKNVFKIAFACSGAVSFCASEIIKKRLAEDTYHIFYRGEGWPGFNTLTNGSNKIEALHSKSTFERMYSSELFKNSACRFCPSHFAENSDLTLFDFWNESEMQSEREGNSVCVIRTGRGKTLTDLALKNNYIEFVKSISEEEALKTQASPLKKKHNRPYEKMPLKLYYLACGFIFKTRLYRILPLKAYSILCKLLAKLSRKV